MKDKFGRLQNMNRASTLLLTLALATGCNRPGDRTGVTQVQMCSNLTVTIYQQVTPDGVETTTVHEVWKLCYGSKRLVTSIYSDSRRHVITLVPTPITTDWLPFSPGIFYDGTIPDVPAPTLTLSIDQRGAVGYMQGFTKRGNQIYTYEQPASDAAKMIDRMRMHIRIVNLAIEGGAPLDVVTNQIQKWTSAGADVRLSVIPWELAHPTEIIDTSLDTEPQPSVRGDGKTAPQP